MNTIIGMMQNSRFALPVLNIDNLIHIRQYVTITYSNDQFTDVCLICTY